MRLDRPSSFKSSVRRLIFRWLRPLTKTESLKAWPSYPCPSGKQYRFWKRSAPKMTLSRYDGARYNWLWTTVRLSTTSHEMEILSLLRMFVTCSSSKCHTTGYPPNIARRTLITMSCYKCELRSTFSPTSRSMPSSFGKSPVRMSIIWGHMSA